MKAKIIRIGNSKGIRLPKLLIEQVGLAGEVDLKVRDGELIISPSEQLRCGWDTAARVLADNGEDKLLDPVASTGFDEQEWKW